MLLLSHVTLSAIVGEGQNPLRPEVHKLHIKLELVLALLCTLTAIILKVNVCGYILLHETLHHNHKVIVLLTC